jgi:predicted MPP superfamily phosphohydrolase
MSFAWASVAGALLVVVAAGLMRGRLYATFAAVLLTFHTSISIALWPSFQWAWPAYVYLQVVVYLHFALLAKPSLKPWTYRALVSMPASFFWGGTFLALPWALVRAFGAEPALPWIPYVIAAIGLWQSLRRKPEMVDVALDRAAAATLGRRDHGDLRIDRPLRIVQITDPHLGPFMSARELKAICERAVARDPDLVLLTGDFVTMESHHAEEAMIEGLSPLRSLPGRVYACMGNHDHEAPEMVRRALDAVGARLLVDESEVAETPAGPVQILGLDFHFKNRREKIAVACAAHPRVAGALRLVLLHDPGAFVHVPDGDGDLVLAGHTHGGQLGLVSLGLKGTFVSAFTKIPDHGFWAHGTNRMYVHRGTGHYGFPLRVGVPSEESLVRVHYGPLADGA